MRILLVFEPVAALGQARDGVETTVVNLSLGLQRIGHEVEIVAPSGSELPGVTVHAIPGVLQPTHMVQPRSAPIEMPPGGVLANMWDHVQENAARFDAVANFAFDWLPAYLLPFLNVKAAMFLTVSSCLDYMDAAVTRLVSWKRNCVAAYTRAQAATFPAGDAICAVAPGVEPGQYDFAEEGDGSIAWLGRISPEKAVEDALAVAELTGRRLRILGHVQDEAYWAACRQRHPRAAVDFAGYLRGPALTSALRRSSALLLPSRWIEAFGFVALDALACGVPVVTYRGGGPAEIVEDGRTGYVVAREAGPQGLAEAVERVHGLERRACRQAVEEHYRLEHFAERFAAWLASIPPAAATSAAARVGGGFNQALR